MTTTKRRALRVRRTRRKGERMRKVGGGTRRKGVRKGCRKGSRTRKVLGGVNHAKRAFESIRDTITYTPNNPQYRLTQGSMKGTLSGDTKKCTFIFYKMDTDGTKFAIYYERDSGWMSGFMKRYGEFRLTNNDLLLLLNHNINMTQDSDTSTHTDTSRSNYSRKNRFTNITVNSNFAADLKRDWITTQSEIPVLETTTPNSVDTNQSETLIQRVDQLLVQQQQQQQQLQEIRESLQQ